MTDNALTLEDRLVLQSSAIPTRAAVAAIVGNWFEFFDFVVYTYFAVMIGRTFFPDSSEYASILKAVAVFGAGFITRPLGAAIIGRYADRAGRRPALVLTLLLMAAGTLMLGLVPSYASIGPAAPCLVLVARLIQGFAVGGEMGPATSYLLETAAPHRRAWQTAWQTGSQTLAIIAGSALGYGLSVSLSHDALYAWGWRVPFFIGALIAPFGFYIRRALPETLPVRSPASADIESFWQVVATHKATIAAGVMIVCGFTVTVYVGLYFTTYAISTLHLPTSMAMLVSLVANILSLAGLPVGAYLADRYDRKRVLVITRAIFTATIFPLYFAMIRPGAGLGVLIGANCLLGFLASASIGGVFALLAEAFPRSRRSSGLSVLYALGVTIFGATTQPMITFLIVYFKNPMMPAWYMIASQIVSMTGILLIRSERLRD